MKVLHDSESGRLISLDYLQEIEECIDICLDNQEDFEYEVDKTDPKDIYLWIDNTKKCAFLFIFHEYGLRIWDLNKMIILSNSFEQKFIKQIRLQKHINDVFIQKEIEMLNDKNVKTIYNYISSTGEPWPEAESIIITNNHYSVLYATNILRKRWIDAEATILNPNLLTQKPNNEIWTYGIRSHLAGSSYNYIETVLQTDFPTKKWPEAEPFLIDIPNYAFLYAAYVLKQRWIEAEESIKQYHDKSIKIAYEQHFNIKL